MLATPADMETKGKNANAARSPFKASISGGPPTIEQQVDEKDENGVSH